MESLESATGRPRDGATAKTAKPIGQLEMSPTPYEGLVEEGLSSSLLPIVHDPQRLDHLRAELSGLCHRCRNSLNGIKLSLYLFRREAGGAVPDCWGEIERIYHQVEHLFDHLQAIYRPMTVMVIRTSLDELLDDHLPKWRSWFESRGLDVQLEPPESGVVGDFDPAQLGVGLDAMAAWRAEVGHTGVLAHVAWRIRDGWIEIHWKESRHRHDSEPDEDPSTFSLRDGGSSSWRVDLLALPLLARIIVEHGGRLDFIPSAGFHVRLQWPQFQQQSHGC
jgi:hypothetical protein